MWHLALTNRRLDEAHRLRPSRTCECAPLWLLARFASFFAIATLFAMPNAVLAQQTGTITGMVREASSGLPLPGARVGIEDAAYGGLTNADGRFLLLDVPAGTYRLRVELLGYATEVYEVTVAAGQTVTSDVNMTPSAISLDEMIVTVTGERKKRELGNAVATIETADVLEVAPVHTMSDLLTGRTAGVTVLGSSGGLGMGSRIRIRGASSISLSNEPLLYVDGIRVDNRSEISVYAGGQHPSRLDDFNPEDIESIEIVKGPAAATLYGTEAANGVIRITTKRGRPGATRWNAWSESGLVQDRTNYPLNYAGLDPAGGFFAERCTLDFEAQGRCTQEGIRSYQVLNDPNLSPIADGFRQQVGMNVAGGSDQVSFYLSAETESETGPFELPGLYADTLRARSIPVTETTLRPQQLKRATVRANLDAAVGGDSRVQLSVGYVTSDLSILQNGNDGQGLLWSGLAGGTDPDDPARAWGGETPAETFGQTTSQSVERFTASINGLSSPRSWLDLRATVGLDYGNRHDILFIPRDLGVPGQANFGQRNSNYTNTYRYTVDAGATLKKDVSASVGSKTSVGFQYFRNRLQGTSSRGQDIVNGAGSISAAAETSSNERFDEDKTVGLFVEQIFDLRSRLFVTAALRADDNSAFGRDFDLIYYPKAAVSWAVSAEDFFPEWSFIDEVRLRTAWGRSGLQPSSTAAITTLDAFSVTDGSDQTVSGVRIGDVGNTLLEPELSSELEIGMDAQFLGGRVGLELTYYDKSTTGALVRVPLPPSLGSANARWANIGDVVNRGVEAAIFATPVATNAVRWDLSLLGSNNRNELLSLGEELPRIGEGGPNFVPGYPLGGNWGPHILGFDDADANGIITSDELTISDTIQYTGPTTPTKDASLSSTVTLFQRLRIYALFEYRGGFTAGNGTEWFRCRLRRCRALNDRSAPLWDQARAVATVYHPSLTFQGYQEDGTFTKLRELSLSYTLPEAWVSRMGADRLTVTVAGRNLKTWTDYTGFDPENQWFTGANFSQNDFLTQPTPRYWTLRFNVGF